MRSAAKIFASRVEGQNIVDKRTASAASPEFTYIHMHTHLTKNSYLFSCFRLLKVIFGKEFINLNTLILTINNNNNHEQQHINNNDKLKQHYNKQQ